MTTAGDIINQALKDIGLIGPGETASGEDAADAFTALNQLIADWQLLPGNLPPAPYVLALVADPADDLNLPLSYDSPLRYSLAERLFTVFSVPPRPDIIRLAAQARKNLKRSNLVIPDGEMPGALQFGRRVGTCCGND